MRIAFLIATVTCLAVTACRTVPVSVDECVEHDHLEKIKTQLDAQYRQRIGQLLEKYPLMDKLTIAVLDPVSRFRTAPRTSDNLNSALFDSLEKDERVRTVEKRFIAAALRELKDQGIAVNPSDMDSMTSPRIRDALRKAFLEYEQEVQYLTWIELSSQGDVLIAKLTVMDISDGESNTELADVRVPRLRETLG